MRYIILLILLSSCGSVYHAGQVKKHQRKIEKHLNWLQDHGAKITSDTLYKQLGIKVPELNITFATQLVPYQSPEEVFDPTFDMDFKSDSADVKLTFKRDKQGKPTEVKPEVNVKPQIIYRDVPYKVVTEVECKQNWTTWEVIKWCLIVGVIAFLIGYFFRVIKRIITVIPI